MVVEDAMKIYEAKEERFGAEAMSEMADWVLLRTIDSKWRDHLYEMDYLREGIGLRALAQRDPLIEYKNEGFKLFQEMMESIQTDFVRYLYHLEIVKEEEPAGRSGPAARLLGRRRQQSGAELRGAAAAPGSRAWPTAPPRPTTPRRRPPGRSWRPGPSSAKWGATIPARAAAARSTRSAAGPDRPPTGEAPSFG